MKNVIMIFLFFIFLAFTLAKEKADLILYNGTVYSLDKNNSVFTAIAIKNGLIIYLGTDRDVKTKYSATESINLNGKFVFPGFIDAHGHLTGYGANFMEVNLYNINSIKKIAELIKKKTSEVKKGEWIFGNYWDQNLLEGKKWPDKVPLDNVAPDNPVYLTRIDGHAVWLNSKALQIAGIDKNTKQVDGGEIIKDENGNPTGILIDNAIGLVSNVLPAKTDKEIETSILKACDELVKFGITELHDMGTSLKTYKILKKLVDNKKLKIRIRGYADGEGAAWNFLLEQKKKDRYADNFISLEGIKLFADGAMGSRGAYLFEPYSDNPNNYGLETMSENDMLNITKTAIKNGLQVATHAIGDKANHLTINAYEKAQFEVKSAEPRLRIEHMQVINSEDLQRLKPLGIIPGMQPKHATSDMYWAEARLGPVRVENSYAYKSAIINAGMAAGGSDVPVEIPDVLEGLHSAVTRQNKKGEPKSAEQLMTLIKNNTFVISADGIKDEKNYENGWFPKQKISIIDALNMFTKWAAYAVFEEDFKGTIETGKWADLTITDKDLLNILPQELLKTKIKYTIVNGLIVYKN